MVERCKSCGIEMPSATDHAGEDIDNPYCSNCADHEGNLKSRKAVEENLKRRLMEEHDADEHKAREAARRQMDEMPAWE
jgi:hypothetical protein